MTEWFQSNMGRDEKIGFVFPPFSKIVARELPVKSNGRKPRDGTKCGRVQTVYLRYWFKSGQFNDCFRLCSV